MRGGHLGLGGLGSGHDLFWDLVEKDLWYTVLAHQGSGQYKIHCQVTSSCLSWRIAGWEDLSVGLESSHNLLGDQGVFGRHRALIW